MSNKPQTKLEDETESERNKKPITLVIGLLMVIFGGFIFWQGVRSVTDNKSRVFAPNGFLNVEIADTPSLRSKGLSNRDFLASNDGMLFKFDNGDANCFWMKDTRIPLDMVWLDTEKKVVFVHKNAEPESTESICPDVTATYVIEVNAGRADELGLEKGKQVRF